MGQSRKPYAVQWMYPFKPSQRTMRCERGHVFRMTVRGLVRYLAFGSTDGFLGEFPQRKHAMAAVEGFRGA